MLCTLGIVENTISPETTFHKQPSTTPVPEITSPVILPAQRQSLEVIPKDQNPGGSQDDADSHEQTLQVVWSEATQVGRHYRDLFILSSNG